MCLVHSVSDLLMLIPADLTYFSLLGTGGSVTGVSCIPAQTHHVEEDDFELLIFLPTFQVLRFLVCILKGPGNLVH